MPLLTQRKYQLIGEPCLRTKGETRLMKRKRMKARKDKAIFTRTAEKTKKINVNPSIPRGGIRL